MLRDIRDGRIKGLIFSDLTGLARDARELLEICDTFRGVGAVLVSVRDGIDTSTPLGRLFFTLVDAMAVWERDGPASRALLSANLEVSGERPFSGRVAFGYHIVDRRIVPHPDEAPIRALIYELFAKHQRKKTVARLLNQQGHRTRAGSRFTDTTVERLLRDPTAKGQHRANFTQRVAANKPWMQKPEHEWILSSAEPIVSAALWEQCNALLDAHKAQGRRPNDPPPPLFAGLVFCTCRRAMGVSRFTGKYVCDACQTSVTVMDLDLTFEDELATFSHPDGVPDFASAREAELSCRQTQFEALGREVERVSADIDRLFQLFDASALTPEQFKERFQPLEEHRRVLLGKRSKLAGEIAAMRSESLCSEYLLRERTLFYQRWPSMNFEERRRLVELMVKRVLVSETQIELSYSFAAAPIELPQRRRMV